MLAVIERPFHDLLAAAHACHRERFNPHEIEGAKPLSIKTGACPEDCAYCPQSAQNETDQQPEPLMDLPDSLTKAEKAKAEGATRFCMGAAWRSPNDRQADEVAEATGDLEPAFRECSDQPADPGAGKAAPRATRVRAARVGVLDRGGKNRDARVDDPLVGGSFVDVGGDPCVVSSRRRIEHFPR